MTNPQPDNATTSVNPEPLHSCLTPGCTGMITQSPPRACHHRGSSGSSSSGSTSLRWGHSPRRVLGGRFWRVPFPPPLAGKSEDDYLPPPHPPGEETEKENDHPMARVLA